MTPDEIDLARLGWTRLDPLAGWVACAVCDTPPRRAFWAHTLAPGLRLCSHHLCRRPEVRDLDRK